MRGALFYLGSPAFQPPEIASGWCLAVIRLYLSFLAHVGAERFSGVKGDVWAAGISLYVLCIDFCR